MLYGNLTDIGHREIVLLPDKRLEGVTRIIRKGNVWPPVIKSKVRGILLKKESVAKTDQVKKIISRLQVKN